jgi:hypothetical protein
MEAYEGRELYPYEDIEEDDEELPPTVKYAVILQEEEFEVEVFFP